MKPGEKPTVLRATFEVPDVGALTLRAGDKAVSADQRNALLARVAAGEHVELEMDIIPFRQRDGERNRNNIRFRDGAMRRLGSSGKGMPFLRNHAQYDQMAVGGTIASSKMEHVVADGAAEWQLHQTVKLSAPWAVDQALRGLIHFFSIGWDPTGAVLCSVCGNDYYKWGDDGCRHYRGQVLDDGAVVELVYQDAVLVETSAVPVPAVLGTEVEEIRAAARAGRLATAGQVAALGTRVKVKRPHMPTHSEGIVEEINAGPALGVRFGNDDVHRWYVPDEVEPVADEGRDDGMQMRRAALSATRLNGNGGEQPRGETMQLIAKLAPILLLAATASESEVLSAVEKQAARIRELEADLQIANADLETAQKKVDEFESTAAKLVENEFIRDALATGRIGKGDEEVWREVFQANPEGAKAKMSKRRPNQATPVGAPRQSDKAPAEPAPAANEIAAAREKFNEHGVNFEQAATFAAKFGAKNPEAALAKLAGQEV